MPPQAFLWRPGHGIRNLGVLPDQLSSEAADVNDAGYVVGTSYNGDTHTQLSFIWDKRNGMRALDASVGNDRHGASGINRRGQIIGSSEINADHIVHGYFRDLNGDVLDLGTLRDGNPHAFAVGVNDSGVVVGVDSGPLISEPFIWDKANGIRPLFEPPSPLGIVPSAINNRGEVIGFTGGDATRGFRWTAREGLQDLGSLGGNSTDFTDAFGINAWGTIVGGSQVSGRRRAGVPLTES